MEPITEQPITKKETIELAILWFGHIEGQLSRADTKAELTLTADALLVAATTSLGKGMITTILDGTASIAERAAAVFTVLMFATLLVSVYYALMAVMPKLVLPVGRPKNFFYFGSIARLKEQEFIDGFANQQWDEIRTTVLAEVYTIAQIAQRKFSQIRQSHSFLLMSLILWAIAQFLAACLP